MLERGARADAKKIAEAADTKYSVRIYRNNDNAEYDMPGMNDTKDMTEVLR